MCLEVPQELREGEAFPKEELSSTQQEEDMAELHGERPASESVQQGEQRLRPPDGVGSAKSEELRMVKLEEEEAPPAGLDTAAHPSQPGDGSVVSGGTVILYRPRAEDPARFCCPPSLHSKLLAKDPALTAPEPGNLLLLKQL